MAQSATLDLRLVAIRRAAQDIHLFEFRDDAETILPPFGPGAHIDVHLPNGMVRPYSLAMTREDGNSFVVGVKLDAASRGGSRFMHEQLRVGTVLKIGVPRNNFPLHEEAECSVFFAGGIGITPIFAMATHLSRAGKPWKLHYAVRKRSEAAFVNELLSLEGGSVNLHIDEEAGGRFLDVAGLVAAEAGNAHFYCCGPAPMLDSYLATTASLPREQVHCEYFGALPQTDAPCGGYWVELAKSGQRFKVPPGQTVVQAMRSEGLDPMVSCEQGHCGSCEARVLSGAIEHRDVILSPEERASGTIMMLCVSHCTSETLVLDL
jgi:Flavodoxin reductases (ferredoxin-NADPH reductases) family 1